MIESEDRRGPGLKFPPPGLMILMVGGAYIVDLYFPFPIHGQSTLWLPGLMLMGLALLIATASLARFLRANTKVEPWRPTTVIIQDGVFRFSRNPIYLAFCIATVSCGFLLNSGWILISVLPLIYLLQKLVIAREESYLEQKFGKEYLDYKSRVRRWF